MLVRRPGLRCAGCAHVRPPSARDLGRAPRVHQLPCPRRRHGSGRRRRTPRSGRPVPRPTWSRFGRGTEGLRPGQGPSLDGQGVQVLLGQQTPVSLPPRGDVNPRNRRRVLRLSAANKQTHAGSIAQEGGFVAHGEPVPNVRFCRDGCAFLSGDGSSCRSVGQVAGLRVDLGQEAADLVDEFSPIRHPVEVHADREAVGLWVRGPVEIEGPR